MLATALLVVLALCAVLHDTSWDSESYHFPGMLELLRGWNPLAEPGEMLKSNIWPNGLKTIQAQIARATGVIEGGEMLTAVLGLAALALWTAALRELRQRPLERRELAALYLLIANPVALGQLLTFYLDGNLYYLSLILLAGLLLAGTSRRPLALLVVTGTVVLLINSKLAGIYYAGAVAMAGWLLAPMSRAERLRTAWVLLAAAAIACGFVGYRPYVTNLLAHDTILVKGPWWFQRPANLEGVPSPLAFAASLIAETANGPGAPVRWKLPLLVQPHEVLAMAAPDVRVGGFGPLFAPALALAGLVGLVAARDIWADRVARTLAALAFALLAICAIFPEPTHARYVAPAWAAMGLLLLSPPAMRVWSLRLTVVAVLLGGVNGAMALVGNTARLAQGHLEWREMAEGLRNRAASLVVVPSDDSHFHVTVADRLARLGLPARPGRQRDCGTLLLRYRSNTFTAPRICAARSD